MAALDRSWPVWPVWPDVLYAESSRGPRAGARIREASRRPRNGDRKLPHSAECRRQDPEREPKTPSRRTAEWVTLGVSEGSTPGRRSRLVSLAHGPGQPTSIDYPVHLQDIKTVSARSVSAAQVWPCLVMKAQVADIKPSLRCAVHLQGWWAPGFERPVLRPEMGAESPAFGEHLYMTWNKRASEQTNIPLWPRPCDGTPLRGNTPLAQATARTYAPRCRMQPPYHPSLSFFAMRWQHPAWPRPGTPRSAGAIGRSPARSRGA